MEATEAHHAHPGAPNILRAGDHEDFFAWSPSPGKLDLFERLNVERAKITARICYCSVFDECWVSSGLAMQTACPVVLRRPVLSERI
jgi:hypothetical protein